MHKLIKPIFWTFLFLVMMLVIDQFLLQVPPLHPAHAAVSNFYRDFRERLVDLAFGEKQDPPKSIEAVIEKQQKAEAPPVGQGQKPAGTPAKTEAKTPAKTEAKAGGRYLYSDGSGELHFADSLNDVPKEYRSQAQPLAE